MIKKVVGMQLLRTIATHVIAPFMVHINKTLMNFNEWLQSNLRSHLYIAHNTTNSRLGGVKTSQRKMPYMTKQLARK